MLRSHTHNHHPLDGALKHEVRLYAEELKQAAVLKPSTDPIKFADHVCADVLAT
jgi:NitT/TauT family transport system substrate-binding protein